MLPQRAESPTYETLCNAITLNTSRPVVSTASVAMWRAWLTLVAVRAALAIRPGPAHPPTRGALWPRPLRQEPGDGYFTFDPAHFSIAVEGETCAVLRGALERYSFTVRDAHRLATRYPPRRSAAAALNDTARRGLLRTLRVDLTAPCEPYPYLGMDEAYNLAVADGAAALRSGSLWGALRGLESWAQLFYVSEAEAELRIDGTSVADAPRYAHRGLLLDTSRHFLSLAAILRTLDAMAMNKMNVLHWHIVDDQSFPYQSERFPDLSRLGAYHASMVYSPADIRLVVEYARDRGVRVLPEFDVPGHTRSWGEAFPDVLTPCYRDGVVVGLGPMHPLRQATFDLLRDLFAELRALFPEPYLHVGGDEVDLECWESNPELQEYMRAHNMSSASELHALFMRRAVPLLARGARPVVWQEVFDEGVPLANDTVVQVWKGGEVAEMMSILRAGHRLVFSSAWYLDHLRSGGDWEAFYAADPRRELAERDRSLPLERVLGGEACMWGEVVDDSNVASRVWPRASAVAERLWSPPEAARGAVAEDVFARLEEHACRMARRGVRAQPPSGPGYCLGAA